MITKFKYKKYKLDQHLKLFIDTWHTDYKLVKPIAITCSIQGFQIYSKKDCKVWLNFGNKRSDYKIEFIDNSTTIYLKSGWYSLSFIEQYNVRGIHNIGRWKLLTKKLSAKWQNYQKKSLSLIMTILLYAKNRILRP